MLSIAHTIIMENLEVFFAAAAAELCPSSKNTKLTQREMYT